MDIGDRVRKIKGNPFGKTGVIIEECPVRFSEVVNLDENPTGLKGIPTRRAFTIKSDDGEIFDAFEDELELIEKIHKS